jgi:hypothetical protein
MDQIPSADICHDRSLLLGSSWLSRPDRRDYQAVDYAAHPVRDTLLDSVYVSDF